MYTYDPWVGRGSIDDIELPLKTALDTFFVGLHWPQHALLLAFYLPGDAGMLPLTSLTTAAAKLE